MGRYVHTRNARNQLAVEIIRCITLVSIDVTTLRGVSWGYRFTRTTAALARQIPPAEWKERQAERGWDRVAVGFRNRVIVHSLMALSYLGLKNSVVNSALFLARYHHPPPSRIASRRASSSIALSASWLSLSDVASARTRTESRANSSIS